MRHGGDRVLFISADPAIAYGLRNDPGARMLAACRLSFGSDDIFYLTGDFHHYERRKMGPTSLHVIAGGGGAFLHGTRISPYPEPAGPPACVYPTAAMSRQLAAQVPLKLLLGRAGFVAHNAFALVGLIEMYMGARSPLHALAVGGSASAVFALLLYLIAGHQGFSPRRIAMYSLPFGLVLGLLPAFLRQMLPGWVPALAGDGAVIVIYAFVGALVFGLFLMTMAILGLEHQQAFTVLGHPGFKHFVRLCVHPNGRVEGWVIGKDDMLAPGKPVVIDTFQW
jgi:hypothetical protein